MAGVRVRCHHSVAFQFIFQAGNDLSASLIDEMTAQLGTDSAQFCRIQGFAQMGRRIGNCLSGFAGPVLFGLNPQAPFLLAAGLVFSWALFTSLTPLNFPQPWIPETCKPAAKGGMCNDRLLAEAAEQNETGTCRWVWMKLEARRHTLRNL